MKVSMNVNGSGAVSILTGDGVDLARVTESFEVIHPGFGYKPRATLNIAYIEDIDIGSIDADVFVMGKRVRRIEFADGEVQDFTGEQPDIGEAGS